MQLLLCNVGPFIYKCHVVCEKKKIMDNITLKITCRHKQVITQIVTPKSFLSNLIVPFNVYSTTWLRPTIVMDTCIKFNVDCNNNIWTKASSLSSSSLNSTFNQTISSPRQCSIVPHTCSFTNNEQTRQNKI
jgi:hypothetical protein